MLTIVGIIGETPEQIAKSGGLALNLWTGLVMLVVGIIFYIWAFTKPPLPPEQDHVDHYQEGGPLHMGHDFAELHPDEVERRKRTPRPRPLTDRPERHQRPREGGADVRSGPVTAQCRWSDA